MDQVIPYISPNKDGTHDERREDVWMKCGNLQSNIMNAGWVSPGGHYIYFCSPHGYLCRTSLLNGYPDSDVFALQYFALNGKYLSRINNINILNDEMIYCCHEGWAVEINICKRTYKVLKYCSISSMILFENNLYMSQMEKGLYQYSLQSQKIDILLQGNIWSFWLDNKKKCIVATGDNCVPISNLHIEILIRKVNGLFVVADEHLLIADNTISKAHLYGKKYSYPDYIVINSGHPDAPIYDIATSNEFLYYSSALGRVVRLPLSDALMNANAAADAARIGQISIGRLTNLCLDASHNERYLFAQENGRSVRIDLMNNCKEHLYWVDTARSQEIDSVINNSQVIDLKAI